MDGDPRFQLISHLKQFTYSFQSAVLARAKNEHLHGNTLPMMYLAASVPIMFASDMAKWVLTGTVPKNWTFFDYFTHAVARSGVLGSMSTASRPPRTQHVVTFLVLVSQDRPSSTPTFSPSGSQEPLVVLPTN